MADKITTHKELDVYARAFAISMRIFHLSRQFPREEMYALTDQLRRSSRSVCANLAEAWRKRRYEAAFIAKLSDVEAEAAETQVWLEFCGACEYLPREICDELSQAYDGVLRTIVGMISHPDSWVLRAKQ
ncbi:MAG TPA: four helix bundle protein [Armatimonadota bacterium]|nr:four helix bundle protein [Armatimonadota bacterium]